MRQPNSVKALQSKAVRACKARGHKRIAWADSLALGHGWARNGTCETCLAEVRIETHPAPNSIDLAGNAVATDCKPNQTIDRIAQGYLTCAAWSSTQRGKHHDGRTIHDKPIEDFKAQWTKEARLCALALAKRFYHENEADCEVYVQARSTRHAEYTAEECLGHDLWLTRNGHGVGFWDRDLGELGDRLTKAAAALGEQSCYVSKGRIYLT